MDSDFKALGASLVAIVVIVSLWTVFG